MHVLYNTYTQVKVSCIIYICICPFYIYGCVYLYVYVSIYACVSKASPVRERCGTYIAVLCRYVRMKQRSSRRG